MKQTYLPPYLLDYLVSERFTVFRIDAIKAMIYVSITALALYFALKKELSQNIALIVIGLVSLFDLWSVNKRYLNSDNFVDKAFTQTPFVTENSRLFSWKSGRQSTFK